jgi:phosphoribosylglycinamide formyltransferase-1
MTGVTVHFANEKFDAGPIIAQEAIPITEDDTVVTLEAKIHEVEHRILPETLALIADGRVSIDGRKVKIAPKA